jgi:hypothetical protein
VAFEAAVDSIGTLVRRILGDRTMLYALAPTVDVFARSVEAADWLVRAA